tara:strand:+ start:351 stop:596 length:246 start_codon:yes stop_codon:yes gene_type:complete
MSECKVSIILAYFATIYIIASIIYLCITRSYGTPFNDAIQKYPELVEIKKKSSIKRRDAFLQGLGISIIILCLFKPFTECM